MKVTCLLLVLGVLGAARTARATAQQPDYLVYRGDTLQLQSNPLEGWLHKLPQRPPELESGSTACWRGYTATWLLENGQLFLLEIRPGCNSSKASIPLRRWFRPDARGRVAATWVSGTLDMPLGKLLHYEHMGYGSMYEKDWLLTFQHGRLVGQHTYRNRAAPVPESEQLQKQLYQTVEWSRISKQPEAAYRVFVEFRPDSTGRHCAVVIRKGTDQPYAAAALAAARQLARRNWGATYRYGRWVPMRWTMPVTFSEENRRKYARH
ncbi:hypothetical protein [Hymenobacter metallilatus]|uniref:TonB C-terminal domain-containing protein n=1 Tax=Hymenobacter metallilatus TaxID=2493666 RepID=A0A3R9MBX4_9BACT|nr:hypothetical protein [Hymenobacter metallilatus]RSK36177.1 hypothetical protein EI290_04640 [Hymenobacter metallilatus]